MIHKIENLVSIGKFRNYQASGQVNFHKLTLIYGDNGGGKTTLTSVLRSLTENKPEIVKRRISTNHIAVQSGQVIQRTPPATDIFHSYGSSGWSNQLQGIEIFDIHFVNENIYSGFDFSDEHKKQLHQFVIGAQGIAIQIQLDQNKTDKAAKRVIITGLETQIIQLVGNNLTSQLLTTFIALPSTPHANIDALIIAADAALLSANASTTIQTFQPLTSLAPINSTLDFIPLKADLEASTATIQNVSLQTLFEQHCNELSENEIPETEAWLKSGFSYIEKKGISISAEISSPLNCPFCKQGLDVDLDIIKAYTLKFNEEFNSLVDRLQQQLAIIRAFNIDVIIQGMNAVNLSNTASVGNWSTHLSTVIQQPVFDVIENEELLKSKYNSVLLNIQEKLRNPSVVQPTVDLSEFESIVNSINLKITAYNTSVTAYNLAITNFRTNLVSIAQAQSEAERLKRLKKRSDPAVILLCTQITTEKRALKTLEDTYSTLVQQQQTAISTFFNTYKDRINHYLVTVFKTAFKIEDVIHVPPSGRATQNKIGYKLTIDGNDISFDPAQLLSVKDCLSEGDKSTIALAFFLSKLDIDTNLSDKILVFDDPLSSLDSNRRMYTISIIRSLFSQLKQIVVLSHNEYFLHEIGKDFPLTDKKTLRITENFVAKESKLEVCDLNELVKNNYFKHIEALEKFRTTPDILIKDSALGWIRNVLESHIRFKFYRQVRNIPAHQRTFGSLISYLENQNVPFKDNANRIQIVAKLKLLNSVSWRPHHGDPQPNFSTLGIDPNSITVAELDNLIQDTLSLIDNQL